MITHGIAKHKLSPNGSKLREFKRKCTLMSRRGDRYVSKTKILRLMGNRALSKSHRKAVKRVLKGLLYTIGFPTRQADDRRTAPDFVVVPGDGGLRVGPYQPKDGRTTTSRRLSDANLVRRFDPDTMDQLATAYLTEHPNGQTAFVYAKACKIDRYLKFGLRQGYTAAQSIQSTELAREFTATLQKSMQPYSVKNHMDALVDFLQLCCALPTLKAIFPRQRRQRIVTSLEEWKNLRRKADKESRRLQLLKVRKLGFAAAPLLDICDFLSQYRSLELERDFSLVETRIQEGSRFRSAEISAWKRIICYLSTVLALHGQRRGAAFSLTCAEVFGSQIFEGVNIIAIAKHKTDYLIGPAYIAAKPHQYIALRRMAHVRLLLGGEAGSTVIAAVSGREPSDQFLPLEDFLNEKLGKRIPMTFNLIRKTAETLKGGIERSDSRSSTTSDPISSYLCHAQGAVALHYDYKTPQQIVSESRALDQVIVQSIARDMAARRQLPLPATHEGKSTFLQDPGKTT